MAIETFCLSASLNAMIAEWLAAGHLVARFKNKEGG
jgi:hypothetical protein